MPQVNIVIDINDTIYIRNPLETTLGKKLICHSIMVMDEIGFEDFNFKKLAKHMSSTEASVYRYFENKYKLLSYLVAWYWDYMHFMILMDIRNISQPRERLHRIIETLVNSLNNTTAPEYIDQGKLHRIVVENASKVYHTKQVDSLKKVGFYTNLLKLVKTIAGVVREVDEGYKYPVALATNIVDMSLNNEYNIVHLHNLTDVSDPATTDPRRETINMIHYMLDRLL